MLMHFNDARMGIQVGVHFYFRDWNSDQNLLEEIISYINADYPQMIKYPQIFASRKSLKVFALFSMQYIDTFKFCSEKFLKYPI